MKIFTISEFKSRFDIACYASHTVKEHASIKYKWQKGRGDDGSKWVTTVCGLDQASTQTVKVTNMITSLQKLDLVKMIYEALSIQFERLLSRFYFS